VRTYRRAAGPAEVLATAHRFGVISSRGRRGDLRAPGPVAILVAAVRAGRLVERDAFTTVGRTARLHAPAMSSALLSATAETVVPRSTSRDHLRPQSVDVVASGAIRIDD
jgi:hypothetical protein